MFVIFDPEIRNIFDESLLCMQHTGRWLPSHHSKYSEVCSPEDGVGSFKCVWSTLDSTQEQADLVLFYAGVRRKCVPSGPVIGSQEYYRESWRKKKPSQQWGVFGMEPRHKHAKFWHFATSWVSASLNQVVMSPQQPPFLFGTGTPHCHVIFDFSPMPCRRTQLEKRKGDLCLILRSRGELQQMCRVSPFPHA